MSSLMALGWYSLLYSVVRITQRYISSLFHFLFIYAVFSFKVWKALAWSSQLALLVTASGMSSSKYRKNPHTHIVRPWTSSMCNWSKLCGRTQKALLYVKTLSSLARFPPCPPICASTGFIGAQPLWAARMFDRCKNLPSFPMRLTFPFPLSPSSSSLDVFFGGRCTRSWETRW